MRSIFRKCVKRVRRFWLNSISFDQPITSFKYLRGAMHVSRIVHHDKSGWNFFIQQRPVQLFVFLISWLSSSRELFSETKPVKVDSIILWFFKIWIYIREI